MTVELPIHGDPRLLAFVSAGLVAGLILMVRGIPGYRAATRIGDTAASRIASLAVGEALVTGTVEPAELTLVSALQSAPCVWFRSRITTDDGGVSSSLREERAVGFRIHDATGDVRVFPRGARFDVPDCYAERAGWMGDSPPGLDLRTGSPFAPGPADREGQVAALLLVAADGSGTLYDGNRSLSVSMPTISIGNSRRSYHEARIAPGDVVTVVGRAMPFDQLPDPASADVAEADPLLADPEIAADLAEARAAGILETDPDEAWGNAAIPGFGIGRPTRAPELDEGAAPPAVAAPTDARAALAARTFTIAPDALILAASPEVPLVISLGAPAAAEWRHRRQFLVGLLGAALAIISAMTLAIMVTGGGGTGG
jgi:hypothetical protein